MVFSGCLLIVSCSQKTIQPTNSGGTDISPTIVTVTSTSTPHNAIVVADTPTATLVIPIPPELASGDSLLGRWKLISFTGNTYYKFNAIEFFQDSTFLGQTDFVHGGGNYTFIDADHLKLQIQQNIFVFQVSTQDNEFTMQDGINFTAIYQRIDSSIDKTLAVDLLWGRWKLASFIGDTYYKIDVIEFFPEGTFVGQTKFGQIGGSYSMIEGNLLRIETPSGINVLEVQITGSQMIMTLRGEDAFTARYER